VLFEVAGSMKWNHLVGQAERNDGCHEMQLLGELLLNRTNVKVMMRYVSDVKNLQLMMILLKDNSRSIQFEAFHVFKV
jgi:hypothetical protein